MPRVYQCVEWNETTQQCDGAVWASEQSIPDWMPTVDQAQTVGGAIFTSLVLIVAMRLLFPPRSTSDEP